eukprot:scaffold12797_cov129-Isochrysis_galbana.AAC.2
MPRDCRRRTIFCIMDTAMPLSSFFGSYAPGGGARDCMYTPPGRAKRSVLLFMEDVGVFLGVCDDARSPGVA